MADDLSKPLLGTGRQRKGPNPVAIALTVLAVVLAGIAIWVMFDAAPAVTLSVSRRRFEDLAATVLVAEAAGVARWTLDTASEYAKVREQFGKPIGSFQMIQSHLAEMATLIEAARVTAYSALAACDTMQHGDGGRGTIHRLCAQSVMFGAEMLARVTDLAVQIHGGSGFIWDTEVNRHYRNARIASLGGGTTEVRKLIIAEELFRERGLSLR